MFLFSLKCVMLKKLRLILIKLNDINDTCSGLHLESTLDMYEF